MGRRGEDPTLKQESRRGLGLGRMKLRPEDLDSNALVLSARGWVGGIQNFIDLELETYVRFNELSIFLYNCVLFFLRISLNCEVMWDLKFE